MSRHSIKFFLIFLAGFNKPETLLLVYGNCFAQSYSQVLYHQPALLVYGTRTLKVTGRLVTFPSLKRKLRLFVSAKNF